SPPPTSPAFPYTTLFRSHRHRRKKFVAQPEVPAVLTHLDAGHLDRIDTPNLGRDLVDGPLKLGVRECLRSAHGEGTGIDEQGNRSEEHTSELQSRENLVC